MQPQLQFETPENVALEYQPAGLGTRFVAWVLDMILVFLSMFVAFILLLLMAGASHWLQRWLRALRPDQVKPDQLVDAHMLAIAVTILLFAFGGFIYFSLSEWLLHGRTWGKKSLKIRVVKANGFALDLPSILLRNVFRIIDHWPVAWLVPALLKSEQRLGDLVAGTIVVSDAVPEISSVRMRLAARPAAKQSFTFDSGAVARLTASDIDALERLLERWPSLKSEQRRDLGRTFCTKLCNRMEIVPPDPPQQRRFLEDLLANAHRREHRDLG